MKATPLEKLILKLADKIIDKTNDRTCKNIDCRKEHKSSEVARIFGKESAPYLLGYCSAGCYTKDLTRPRVK